MMRIRQAIRSFERLYRPTFDAYLLLSILIASLSIRFNIGLRILMLPIAVGGLSIAFPLGFFRMWQRWQNYRPRITAREA